jgi:hypothetical protein
VLYVCKTGIEWLEQRLALDRRSTFRHSRAVLDSVWQDTWSALRTLCRQPGFTAISVLTLALGIGANTAIVSVCDALLLRALPYPDADRLVALRSSHGPSTGETGLVSPPDLADWQARTTSFEARRRLPMENRRFDRRASSERIHGLWVTPEFFRVFSITRVDGRTFKPEDRGSNSIILSRAIWERRFGADRALIGSMLDVNVINLSGIYGLVAQAVAQRRFEIGVRMALGATPRRMVQLMLARAVTPVAAGALVGFLSMFATAHLLSAMLFETRPFDAMTFVAVAGLFLAVALVAAGVPARRATRVDPLIALRCE